MRGNESVSTAISREPSIGRTAEVARRDFLRSSVAASASVMGLLAASGAAEEETQSPGKVIVGAHPWVYAATQPGYDVYPILDRIFADLKYAGIPTLELMHTALRPVDAEERIASLIEKHGVGVIGSSFGGDMWDRKQHGAILDDANLVIRRLAKLGGKTLGTSVGAPQGKKTAAQFDAQAELLRKIIGVGEKHGVVLNLHNHTYEVENNLHDLRGTLARIPDVKLGPDLNWLLRGGVEPVKFLREFRDHIVFLHLRDQKADGKWSEAMGEGAMDYAAIGKTLREIRFCGVAVIELAHESNFKPTRPLRESLKMSREYVRKVLGY
jgi:sugar phosphate isomerase/epimerase